MSETQSPDKPSTRRTLFYVLGGAALFVLAWYGTGALQCTVMGGEVELGLGGAHCLVQLSTG